MTGLVWRDAREQARQVLDDLWDQTLPVDIIAISRAAGVTPYQRDLPGSMSGMLIKRRGEDARSYIARTDPEVRKRFTCAHELGHYRERQMAGDAEYGFEDSFVDTREGIRRPDYFPHEFFADEFAGAVLMPETMILKYKHEGMPVERMAEVFGVSVSAVRRRLAALRNHPTEVCNE